MKKAKLVFKTFSFLFLPLYFLMILMYFAEIQKEEDSLALLLDQGIIGLGFIFMTMQIFMQSFIGKADENELNPLFKKSLKKVFLIGLVIWFSLEVVLGYWWCFVTGADPLTEHTPFVLIFIGFNSAQYWALKKLGVLGTSE